MDGFSGYNQSRERPKEDFLHHGAGNLLCKGHAIRLGLKNAGATYQRAMTAIFHEMMYRLCGLHSSQIQDKGQSHRSPPD